MLDIMKDCVLDCIKLLPFLYLSYLAVEYAEHRMSSKTKQWIYRAGKAGPVLGALIGVIPQCGFSAAAAGLFAGGIITPGTLLSVFLSTSDEMLPIFISSGTGAGLIGKVLTTKVVIAMVVGLITDLILQKLSKEQKYIPEHQHMCEHDHCGCEHKPIGVSALHHTAQTAMILFGISIVIAFGMEWAGTAGHFAFFARIPVLETVVSGLVGMIPNCAASVLITKLFLENMISAGSLLAGLLCGAGTGLIVLYRENKDTKQNLMLTLVLFVSGCVAGFAAGLFW